MSPAEIVDVLRQIRVEVEVDENRFSMDDAEAICEKLDWLIRRIER